MSDLSLISLKQENLEGLAEAYTKAAPFPHTVLDNFLDEDAFDALLRADSALLPRFSSVDFLTFLGHLTSKSEPLLADVYQDNEAMLTPFIEQTAHVDFAKHLTLNLDRRLELIIFLDGDGSSNSGLRLIASGDDSASVLIRVKANRCVIFDTSDFTPHAQVVDRLTESNGRIFSRYYYSTGRPERERFESIAPLAGDDDGRLPSIKDGIKRQLKLFLPPIVYRLKGTDSSTRITK